MKRILTLLGLTWLVGCTSVLPYGDNITISHWESFSEATAAYEQIIPQQTRLEELEELGFAPDSQPNVRILNRAEILERLLNVSNRYGQQPPKGLRDCLETGVACYGHEVRLRVTHDKRYGSVLADLFNFKRKVKKTGWEFNALIVLVDDLVVFKNWSGTPRIQEYSDVTNPLGPLQSIGPALTPKPSL